MLDRAKHLNKGNSKYPNIKAVWFTFASFYDEVSHGNHNGGCFTYDYVMKGAAAVCDFDLTEKVTIDGLDFKAYYAKQ